MALHYNVVFTGALKPGIDRDAFIQAFMQRFHCDEAKAATVADANKAMLMKGAVAQEAAEEYQRVLEGLGMTVRLDPVSPAPSSPATAPSPAAAQDAADPYQAPKANLVEQPQAGEMSGPTSVPISHGWDWISTAFSDHFRGNALSWIGAVILLFVLNIGLQLVPLLGAIVVSLLSPVLGGGLMLGAHAQTQGERFTVGYLFSGFKQSTGQLILLGVLYLVSAIVLMVLVFATVGGSFAMFGMTGDPTQTEAMMQQSPLAILLPMLVMMLLFIPLLMAYWFAPALIAINGLSALSAAKQSFIGCVKNVLPFLLYGVVMMVLMVIAMIPIGLGYLVLLPVMIISIYTGYRDIFYREA